MDAVISGKSIALLITCSLPEFTKQANTTKEKIHTKTVEVPYCTDCVLSFNSIPHDFPMMVSRPLMNELGQLRMFLDFINTYNPS